MTNKVITILLALSLGILPWAGAQGKRNEPFDLKKSQQELEVMRGILGTTLSFIVREMRSKEKESSHELFGAPWGISELSAFYLHGQGAVFVLPLSSFRYVFSGSFALAPGHEAEALEAVLARDAARYEAMVEAPSPPEGGVSGGVPGGVSGGVGRSRTPAPPARAGTSSRATRPAASQSGKETPEDLRKRLLELQEKVKSRRAENEQRRAQFMEHLSQIKGFLIEALANHGDSLTHVKPTEYINLILSSSEGEEVFENSLGTRSYREVISIQKSTITDYKAGRLTLEAFKQKVLVYNN